MTDRPYFHYGVEKLERLFEAARNDAVLLGALKRELEHRSVPKARALRTQVDNALLKVGSARAPSANPEQQVSIGCSHCGRSNLVVVRAHGPVGRFSCAGCFRPFIVEFENGIMKVTFPVAPSTPQRSGGRLWIGVALAVASLAGLFFLFGART